MALWPQRPVRRLPVALQAPLAGSNNSAVAKMLPKPASPPTTNTLPCGGGVAVWFSRGVRVVPVLLHDPVNGLKGAADPCGLPPPPEPASRTLLSGSRGAIGRAHV